MRIYGVAKSRTSYWNYGIAVGNVTETLISFSLLLASIKN